MSIVLISGLPHGSGKALAEQLAGATNWPLYSREQVTEKARETGIRLSRLEASIIKTPVVSEKLAREKDLYLSLVTKTLCETAVNGHLVYHGRAGHLLLPGIPGLIRVGVRDRMERRVRRVMEDLHLPAEKAREYLTRLDDDVEKWIHYVHRESLQNPSAYDLYLNLQHMNLENASALLKATAGFPAFQLTTDSRKRMDDRCLGASAKLSLAKAPETAGMDLGVRAVNGKVTVTYMPRQESAAKAIPNALKHLKGCRETVCTMAATNILWIQESFSPQDENFGRVTALAKRWGAAVELLQFDSEGKQGVRIPDMSEFGASKNNAKYTGGVEDDDPIPSFEDKGLTRTVEELVSIGRSAGGLQVSGSGRDVIDAVKNNTNYTLIIMGDIFQAKGHETSVRETRELGMLLKDKLKSPVINAADLQDRFLFGKTQALKLFAFILVAICIYTVVFKYQAPILNVLGGELHAQMKWPAAIGVALFVPLVAYVYSTITGLALKLVDID